MLSRKYLFSKAQLKLIVNSKLNYCNSLYFGISDYLIHQLQRVQNAAAKTIVRLYKHAHLTLKIQVMCALVPKASPTKRNEKVAYYINVHL